ncbi:MAG: hypothetical protein WD534_18205 [Phycisphaeraceae bacterium]
MIYANHPWHAMSGIITTVLAIATPAAATDTVAEYTEIIGASHTLAARDIALLAETYDTLQTSRFFKAQLEQVRDAGPAGLPALEALLNRDVWSRNRTATDAMIDANLRKAATEIWYDIHWKTAEEQRRIATAVMSLDPRAQVALAPSVGVKKVEELEGKARSEVYDLLMSDAGYEPNGLNVRRVGRLVDLLGSESFAPTDVEMTRVLSQGGEYGRFVMMSYMAETNRYDDRWLEAFADWMEESDAHEQYDLLSRLHSASRLEQSVPPAAAADRIKAIAIEAATQAVAEVVQDNAQPIEYAMLRRVVSLFVLYEDQTHLRQLTDLYEQLHELLTQATREQILNDVERYQALRWSTREIADELEELASQ